MIKWPITYVDFEGNERTEDFWFNLSKSELMEMNFSAQGGLDKVIQRIIDAQDIKSIIGLFKDIVLKAYGEKSDDGRSFIKVRNGHALSEDFSQTAAYDELFMSLSTDDKAATEFINGVIPKKLAEELKNSEAAEIKSLNG